MRVSRDASAVKSNGDAGQAVQAAQCPTGTAPRVVQTDSPVKLDLLFMIDDSPSMSEEQANLARNFPRLIEALKKLPAGFPDLHLGVLSSDMGAGAAPLVGGCATSLGDRGVLQVRGGCGLDPSKGRYLISQNGGTQNNFEGDIAGVFACLATLGYRGHPVTKSRRFSVTFGALRQSCERRRGEDVAAAQQRQRSGQLQGRGR